MNHNVEYLPHPDEPLAPTYQDHMPGIHELFHKVMTKFERRLS